MWARRLGSHALAISLALGGAFACRERRALPDVPARRVPAAPPVEVPPGDTVVRPRPLEPEGQSGPVYLARPTLLIVRPSHTYLDTAGTRALGRQVAALERAWPSLRAIAESAGYAAEVRIAPGLVLDPTTDRTFVPPVPAGRVGILLLAPGAAAAVFDSLLPASRLRAELKRYRSQLGARAPRA